jgi:hypothetical protein
VLLHYASISVEITLTSVAARLNAALTQRLLQRPSEESGSSSGQDEPAVEGDGDGDLELE